MNRAELIEALRGVTTDDELQNCSDEELQNLFNMRIMLMEDDSGDDEDDRPLLDEYEDEDAWPDELDDDEYASYLDETED